MPYSGGMQEIKVERRPADHENTLPFGPCVGPMESDKGESWFCQGSAFETLDPADVFGLGTVILCGPCRSMRESKIIEENVLSIIGEAA